MILNFFLHLFTFLKVDYEFSKNPLPVLITQKKKKFNMRKCITKMNIN